MPATHTRLTAHDRRRIAVRACVDPRTIDQYLRGRAQSTTSARIEQALRSLAIELRPDARTERRDD